MKTYKAIRWGWRSEFSYVPLNVLYDIGILYDSTEKAFIIRGHVLISLFDDHIVIKFNADPYVNLFYHINSPHQFKIELDSNDHKLFLQDEQDPQEMHFILKFESETDWEDLVSLNKFVLI